jgi:hypothetical protein
LTGKGAEGANLHEVVDVPDDAAAGACALLAVRRLAGEGAIEVVGHRVVHGGAEIGET